MLWVDLLPILFFFIFPIKFKFSLKHLLIFSFVSCSAFLQWLCYFLSLKNVPSFLFVNLYNIFEFFILLLIFNNQIHKKFHFLTSYIFVLIFIILFSIEFNSSMLMQKTLIVSATIYIIWALMALISKVNDYKFHDQQINSQIIFDIAILIYFSGCFTLFIFFDSLNNNSNFYIWTTHNILEIISKLIITYAFWKLPSKSIS
jgi:hypothetical protein